MASSDDRSSCNNSNYVIGLKVFLIALVGAATAVAIAVPLSLTFQSSIGKYTSSLRLLVFEKKNNVILFPFITILAQISTTTVTTTTTTTTSTTTTTTSTTSTTRTTSTTTTTVTSTTTTTTVTTTTTTTSSNYRLET